WRSACAVSIAARSTDRGLRPAGYPGASAHAPRQLVVDRGEVEAACGEQDVQVVDEVGGLLDHALVALRERSRHELDRLLPHLARDARRPALEQPRGVRALGPRRGALR